MSISNETSALVAREASPAVSAPSVSPDGERSEARGADASRHRPRRPNMRVREPFTRRFVAFLRGDPPPRDAPRVFVSDTVQAVAWIQAVSGASSLVGALVLAAGSLMLGGVLLVTSSLPRLPNDPAPKLLLLVTLAAIVVLFTGGLGWITLRAASRLLAGDARGHRVLSILITIQSVMAIGYTVVAAFTPLPLLKVLPGVALSVWSWTILRKWRPGSAAPE